MKEITEKEDILPMKDKHNLVSSYAPTGDQPQAFDKLCAGIEAGM